MSPRPTLVCGTRYGRVYLEAARAMPDACSLVGILARGSEHSRKLAAREGLPLFTRLDQVPGEASLACVAIPSTDHDLLPRLLRRSMDVLCDHPVSSAPLQVCLDEAERGGRTFHVNAHFGHLAAPRAFTDACRTLGREAEALFVDVLTTDRLLYAAFDVLIGAMGPVTSLSGSGRVGGPIHSLRAHVAGAPAALLVQSSRLSDGGVLPDGSPAYVADLRIAVRFPMGALTLLSLAGPVVWNWGFTPSAGRGEDLQPMTVYDGASSTALASQREAANRWALRALLGEAGGGPRPPEQDPGHLVAVSRAWEAAGAACAW